MKHDTSKEHLAGRVRNVIAAMVSNEKMKSFGAAQCWDAYCITAMRSKLPET